jgi:ankyrin repeat protein
LCLSFDCSRLVNVLWKAGAELSGGITTLMAACGGDDEKEVTELIAGGADLDARDDRGKTALMYSSGADRE